MNSSCIPINLIVIILLMFILGIFLYFIFTSKGYRNYTSHIAFIRFNDDDYKQKSEYFYTEVNKIIKNLDSTVKDPRVIKNIPRTNNNADVIVYADIIGDEKGFDIINSDKHHMNLVQWLNQNDATIVEYNLQKNTNKNNDAFYRAFRY